MFTRCALTALGTGGAIAFVISRDYFHTQHLRQDAVACALENDVLFATGDKTVTVYDRYMHRAAELEIIPCSRKCCFNTVQVTCHNPKFLPITLYLQKKMTREYHPKQIANALQAQVTHLKKE